LGFNYSCEFLVIVLTLKAETGQIS